MSEASRTQLVVVGSSAGGIEALSKLVSTLPEDFPAPIVIAQHLDPKRESHLQPILANRSALPVRTVSDEEPLEDGVIFVVPANNHINITDSHIGMRSDAEGRPKPSVDLLLGSAAEVFGERLIAVVLTGTGNDGTDGARLVSEWGGTVVIQNPETADFRSMPASLAPNTVDVVADLDEIVRILVDLLEKLDGATGEPPEGEQGELKRLLEGLREAHGVDFASYKETTIVRRLKRRMAITGQATIADYRRYLEANPDEYRSLVSSFLIKVTEFFRDPEHFEYLQNDVLPRLVEEAREGNRGLRIWSAGCATGEEAYSLAIALSEVLGGETGFSNMRIFATDIAPDAIEFARQGIYSASAVRGLSAERLERYFDESDGSYRAKKTIRSMIVFGEHDLSRRSPFPNMDLCVSRNVLIYFAPELQKRALQLFAYSLRDGGALVLGKAETVHPLNEYFAPVSRQHKVYRRQGERFLMPPVDTPPPSPTPRPKSVSGEGAFTTVNTSPPGRLSNGGPEDSLRARGTSEDGLLVHLPVGIVVVDRRYDIKAINAPARRLLSIQGAAVGEDFLYAMREAPYAEIRAALDAALRDGGPSSSGEFALEDALTGEPRHLRLDCYPRRDEGAKGAVETVMISVNDITREAAERRALAQRLSAMSAELETFKRASEAETARLGAQNERLVEANRRLEEANRELGDMNEGLQTGYEESLMASEELQATIEELQRTALEALGESEVRYRSLAESTSSIVWTGDRNGAIVEEIPAWEEFTGQTFEEYRGFGWLEALHPEDRPPENLWKELLASDPAPMEEEYRLGRRDGEYRRVVMRGVSISDKGGETREWVGTIFDIKDTRWAAEKSEELRRETERERARLQTILQQMPGGVFIADAAGRFVLSNEGGERIYGRKIGSVAECIRYSRSYPDGGELPPERDPLACALRGEAVTDMECYTVRPDGTRRIVRVNSAPVRDEGGNVVAAVKTFDDVTERVRAEEERDRMRGREQKAHEQVEEAERRLAYYAGAREERQVISRELHDRVAHSIAVVRQNLELYEVLRDRNPEAAAKKMELAKEEARASLKSTRDLSMMLRRSEVEEGITKALASLEETTVPMGMHYESTITGDESLVPPHIGNQIFLVLREAVRNAVSHSGCEHVAVGLDITDERVIGTVEDDGQGFEPDEVRANGGLRSMEERASLVGGEFRLSSAPGGGARIEVCVPLTGKGTR